MSQATFSIRMDNTLKTQFEKLCSDFGMNMSTAINVFARAVVRERRIPFEIVSPEPDRAKALQALTMVRKQSVENFPDSMTLDEINDEISKVRSGEVDAI